MATGPDRLPSLKTSTTACELTSAEQMSSGTLSGDDSTGTGVLTLASGWHDIEVRLGQGAGGAGPSANDGWNTALGLGIDLTLPIDPAAGANPNPSPVQANFVAPLDNGLMNLFRTTVSSGVNVAANSILNAGGMTNVGNLNLQGLGSEVNLNGGAGAAVASSVGTIAVSGSASGTMNIARAGDSLTAGALNLGGAPSRRLAWVRPASQAPPLAPETSTSCRGLFSSQTMPPAKRQVP